MSKDTEYIYCTVEPAGRSRAFAYISPFENIKVGDTVEAPWGSGTVFGKVIKIERVTAETAPYPVEKTKRIIRIADISEQKNKKYLYCGVQPEVFGRVIYYISPFENIKVGDAVEVPIWWFKKCFGTVTSVARVTAENAPWSVADTKNIIRIADKAELEKKEYVVCGIKARGEVYYCLSPFEDINVGDDAEFSLNTWIPTVGKVVSVGRYTKNTSPVPLSETDVLKKIVRSRSQEAKEAQTQFSELVEKYGKGRFTPLAVEKSVTELFGKITFFACAVFRGLLPDARAALDIMYKDITDCSPYLTELGDGIVQFECKNDFVLDVLTKVPNLKAVFFAEDWKNGRVYLAYSESGYGTVTSLRPIAGCKFFMRDRWTVIHDPTEASFTGRDLLSNTDFTYTFSETENWERCDYVIADGKEKLYGGAAFPSRPYKKKRITGPCEIIKIVFPNEN